MPPRGLSTFVRRPPKNAPRDCYATDSSASRGDDGFKIRALERFIIIFVRPSVRPSVAARRRRLLLLRPRKATALRYPSTNLRANRP